MLINRPMTISIVIPAHNEEGNIGACLESIAKHVGDAPELLEIVVVNNASTDRTKEVALRFPRVRVVDEPRKGLTRARQRGLVEARGELLSYLDADTRIHPQWLPLIREEFSKDPHLVSLSGPCHYYDLPPVRKFFGELGWKVAPLAYIFTRHMVYGANFTAKRDALIAMGGFDTSIEFYGEDTNISWRLHKLGKVRFRMAFFVYNSGRRIAHEGLVQTYLTYAMNVIWGVLFHKPFTHAYKDVRTKKEG